MNEELCSLHTHTHPNTGRLCVDIKLAAILVQSSLWLMRRSRSGRGRPQLFEFLACAAGKIGGAFEACYNPARVWCARVGVCVRACVRVCVRGVRVCVRVCAHACEGVRAPARRPNRGRLFLHPAPTRALGVLRGARAVHRHQVTQRNSRN